MCQCKSYSVKTISPLVRSLRLCRASRTSETKIKLMKGSDTFSSRYSPYLGKNLHKSSPKALRDSDASLVSQVKLMTALKSWLAVQLAK